MSLASLTEAQSFVLLCSLGVVLVLLIITAFNTVRRVNELEKVVFKSSEKTAELHSAIDSVHEAQETG